MTVQYGTLAKGAQFLVTGYRSAVVTEPLTKDTNTRAVRGVCWWPMHPADEVVPVGGK